MVVNFFSFFFFFLFLLEIVFGSRVGVAADDQTEQDFSLWKTDFAFFINIVRFFFNFSVLNV